MGNGEMFLFSLAYDLNFCCNEADLFVNRMPVTVNSCSRYSVPELHTVCAVWV